MLLILPHFRMKSCLWISNVLLFKLFSFVFTFLSIFAVISRSQWRRMVLVWVHVFIPLNICQPQTSPLWFISFAFLSISGCTWVWASRPNSWTVWRCLYFFHKSVLIFASNPNGCSTEKRDKSWKGKNKVNFQETKDNRETEAPLHIDDFSPQKASPEAASVKSDEWQK